jgi:hypothetical protein
VLLDGTPITDIQRQALLDGLQGLTTWGSRLNTYDLLSQRVTVIDQGIGSALQLNQIFNSKLYQPASQYLATPAPTVEGLVDALNAVPEMGGTVNGRIDPVANEIHFELVLDVATTSSRPLNLGSKAAALGMSLPTPPALAVTTSVHTHFSFNVGLAANDFYLRLDTSDRTRFAAAVHATGLNFDVYFSNPATTLQVTAGTLDLDAAATATFLDPHGNGTLTLGDLRTAPLGNLVSLGAFGAVSGNLLLNAALPGFEILGPATIVVSAGNVFNPPAPDVSLSTGLSSDLRSPLQSIANQLYQVGYDGYRYRYNALNRGPHLPLIDKSLDEAFYSATGAHLEEFLNFTQAMATYFQNGDAATAGGLVGALLGRELALAGSDTTGTLANGPLSIVGGLDPIQRQVRFDITLDGHQNRTLPINLNLGSEAQALYGLVVTASPTATATVRVSPFLRFSFGMDLNSYLADPTQGFQNRDVFLQVNNLTLAADIRASGVNADLNAGFLQAGIVNGVLNLGPTLDVTFQNPDGSRKVTLQDLQGPDPDAIFIPRTRLIASGTLGANLPVRATLGDYDFSAGNPRIDFSGNDLFNAAPVIQTLNFNQLAFLKYVGPVALLSKLDDLGTWFKQFSVESAFQVDALHPAPTIPFAQNKNLDDVFHLGEVFHEGLFTKLTTTVGQDTVPTFTTAQDLAGQLATKLGLDPQFVYVHFNPTLEELTYHVKFSHSFAPLALPLGFNVADLPLKVIDSSNTITVTADGTLEFTFGVNLNPIHVPVIASKPGPDYVTPLDGKLRADATFSLTIDDRSPVIVHIYQRDTVNNHNLNDLKNVINASLQAAGLGASVRADLLGDRRITLSIISLDRGKLLRLNIASPSDPAVTQLGFEDGLMARAGIDDVFIEQASVTGNAQLWVSDIQTAARFQMLGIQVGHGSTSGNGGLAIDLKNPQTGEIGGRIRLRDLFGNLGNAPRLARASLSGSADLELTNISVASDFLGPLSGNPSVHIAVPNFGNMGAARVSEYRDFVQIQPFQLLTFDKILTWLTNVKDTFRTYPSFGFLNQNLPLIDVSAASVFDYAGRFVTFINNLRSNPPQTMQQLQNRIEKALNLTSGSDPVRVAVEGKALQIGLVFRTPTFHDVRDFKLDVPGLAALAPGGVPATLQDVSRMVNTDVSGQLAVDANAVLHLNMGIDLNDPAALTPFVYDSTWATVEALVRGSNLNFGAAIGPLGLFVKNGTAFLDRDGSHTNRALFTVTLRDKGPGSDHQYYFRGGPDGILPNVLVDMTGKASAALPLFAPTINDSLGVPLTFTINSVRDVLSGRPGSVTVTAPDVSSALHNITALLAMLRNRAVFLNGLDTLLNTLQSGLNSQVLGTSLPIAGRHLKDITADSAKDVTQFVQNLRDPVYRQVSDKINEKKDNLTFADIQGVFANVFGPNGLQLLVGTVGMMPQFPIQTIQFSIHLHQNYKVSTHKINFDLGLPLGLTVTGSTQVQVEVGWDFNFHFGLDLHDGFYLDTSDVNQLRVDLRLTTPGLRATGKLPFLQMDITDSTSSPTNFTGYFQVTLRAPTGNRLTFQQIVAGLDFRNFIIPQLFQISAGADAQVNLHLVTNFGLMAEFGTLAADFNLDWPFRLGNLAGSQPTVAFRNVQLVMGSYIDNVITPVMDRIHHALDPIRPVVEVLGTKVPLIDKTLVDLAKTFGLVPDLNYDDIIEAFKAIDWLTDRNNIPRLGNNLTLDFGDFDFGAVDVRQLGNLSDVVPNVLRHAASVETQVIQMNAPGLLAYVHKLNSWLVGGNHLFKLDFPFLQDTGPQLVFDVYLGKPRDLITFEFTPPTIAFNYSQEFPIFGPIVATLTGRVSATFSAKIGYDTTGLSDFAHSGNAGDLLHGFYIDTDKTYIHAGGGISAGVGIDLLFVAGGVEGGLSINFDVHLHNPRHDGKLRYQYLADISHLFEGSVILSFDLYAWYRVLFFRHEFRIGGVPLLSKHFGPSDSGGGDTGDDYEPILAKRLDNGVLQLNMGPHAAERLEGNTDDEDESFQVRHVDGAGGNETVDVTYLSPTGPITQRYGGVRKVAAQAGHGHETIDLRGVLADSELHGGPDEDTLYGSDGTSILDGGEGDATLYAGAGNSVLTGGHGHKRLFGGSGNATLVVTADTNFTLTDTELDMDGYGTYELAGIHQAVLTGGPSANTFDVSGWTGTATLDGGGGLATVVSSNDADFTLSDNALTRSTGGTFTLVNIQRAVLTGGPGDNTFTVSNWSGSALLDGGDGNDTFVVNFTGRGAGSTTITKSSTTGTVAVVVNGTPAGSVEIPSDVHTDKQVRLWRETVTFDEIDRLTVNGQVIFPGGGGSGGGGLPPAGDSGLPPADSVPVQSVPAAGPLLVTGTPVEQRTTVVPAPDKAVVKDRAESTIAYTPVTLPPRVDDPSMGFNTNGPASRDRDGGTANPVLRDDQNGRKRLIVPEGVVATAIRGSVPSPVIEAFPDETLSPPSQLVTMSGSITVTVTSGGASGSGRGVGGFTSTAKVGAFVAAPVETVVSSPVVLSPLWTPTTTNGTNRMRTVLRPPDRASVDRLFAATAEANYSPLFARSKHHRFDLAEDGWLDLVGADNADLLRRG